MLILERFIIDEKYLYADLDQTQQDNLYRMFQQSYLKATGHSWDEYKFKSRASGWVFFGDPTKGGVAIREQRSGLIKLVASFGSPRAVIEAIQELINTEKKPIWGMMPLNLANHLKTVGFEIVSYDDLMKIKPYISQAMGDQIGEVKQDGAIEIKTDFGTMEKYLVGNKKYFWFLKKAQLGAKIKGILG